MAFANFISFTAALLPLVAAYDQGGNSSYGQFVQSTPNGDDTTVERLDPILAPGSWSQHVHQLFGANSISANATYESLQSATCTTVGGAEDNGNAFDNSIYWHPALYMQAKNGTGLIRVPTNGHRLYYKDAGSEKDNRISPFDFPPGFRMLANSPFIRAAQSPTYLQNITQWICHDTTGSNQGTDGGFPKGVQNCRATDGFNGAIHYPHCWNGQDYDPSNPTAHVVYPNDNIQDGECPDTHKTRLPHIFMENTFNIDAVFDQVVPDSFVLAQGDNTGYGWHADFMNGWVAGAIDKIIKSCPFPGPNEDVSGCPALQNRTTKMTDCRLPTTYKENVDAPGQYLVGCNPINDTNPAAIQPIAPLGVATDVCTGYGTAIAEGASQPTAAAATSAAGTTSAAGAASAGAAEKIVVDPSHSASTTMTTIAGGAPGSGTGPALSSSSSASCPSGNGTEYTTNGASFQILCGVDHAGGDLTSKQVSSFAECISACATTSGCINVSYMGVGCYLKKELGKVLSNTVVYGANLVTSGSSTSASAAATTSPAVKPSVEEKVDSKGSTVWVTEYQTLTTTAAVHRRHAHLHGYES